MRDDDIQREVQNVFMRTDMHVHRFAKCSRKLKNLVVQNVLYVLVFYRLKYNDGCLSKQIVTNALKLSLVLKELTI